MAMKENSKIVFKFLQENPNADYTSAMVAEELGFSTKQVDGIFTSAIQKKGFGYREEDEVLGDDGKHKVVKYLRLSDEGKAFDLNSEETVPAKNTAN